MSYSHTAATRIDQSPCTKQFHARPNQIRAIRHGIGVDSRHGSLWEHLHACYVVLKSYLQNEALKPKLCQPFTYQARCTRRTPWTALLPNVLSADRFKVFPIQWPESCSSSFLPNTPQHSPLASMEDCIDVRFLRFSQQQPSYSWTFLMTVGIVAIHGQM